MHDLAGMSGVDDLLFETCGSQLTDQIRRVEVHIAQDNATEHFNIAPDDKGGAGYLSEPQEEAGERALAWQFSSQVRIDAL